MRSRLTVVWRPAAALRCVALLLLAAAGSARGDAPVVTDSADLIEPKSCQLETWVGVRRDERSGWLQPACNLGHFELALPLVTSKEDGASRRNLAGLQAKTVFAGGEEDGWALGAVGGAGYNAGSIGNSGRVSYYAKGLLSLYVTPSFGVDVNLGGADDDGRGSIMTASAAAHIDLSPRTSAFAEVFRDSRGPASYQVGLYLTLIERRVTAFASYGAGFGAGTGWFSTLGLRFNTAPLLP